MKTLPRRPLSLLAFVAALLAAGCLGGTAPTRFYVLAAVEGPAVSGERAVSVGVA